MDSLLASYGSDDDEEEQQQEELQSGVPSLTVASSQAPPPKVSLFGRLPAPRHSSGCEAAPSGSLFASLPPPQFEAKKDVVVKSEEEEEGAAQEPKPGLRLGLGSGLSATLPPVKEEDEFGTGYRNPTAVSFSKPSLFAALPPPKVEKLVGNPNGDILSASQPSLFAALPPPKVEFDSSKVKAEISYSKPKVKKPPVAFKPPIDVSILEDDDDDWRPAQKKAKAETRSTTPGGGGLSSLLPAPKHTLGLGSTLGAAPASGGRRSAMEVVARPSTQDVKMESAVVNPRISTDPANVKNEAHASQDQLQYDNSAYAVDEISGFVPQYANEPYGWTSTQSAPEISDDVASHYESQNWQYSGNVSSYSSPASYGSTNSAPVAAPVNDPVAQVLQSERRRGREDRMAAPNVIEVKQADLTGGAKLREDQIRTTGIAFGPAYQPVSSKDKPSKLQRRKHQIGTLLQDSKAREMDLLDRRAKGNLTKAETQAKYGW